MAKLVIHLSDMRPNRHGGFNVSSACRRLRTLSDGMNLTDNRKDVTCKLCLKAMKVTCPTCQRKVDRYITGDGKVRPAFHKMRDGANPRLGQMPGTICPASLRDVDSAPAEAQQREGT